MKRSLCILLRIALRVGVMFSTATLTACGGAKPILSDHKVPPAKAIFVFLDGTGNTAESDTNIHKLAQLLINDARHSNVVMWHKGVGSDENRFLGGALGTGMERRMREAYGFIARNYESPRDKVFILGFSRGAFEARALAGLISNAGLPILGSQSSEDDYFEIANDIIDETKQSADVDWSGWSPGSAPPMKGRVESLRTMRGYSVQSAEIAFLGLFDTVPGSLWKSDNFRAGRCKEVGTTRYKLDTYPTIKHIAHAISLDEKRNRFISLPICHDDTSTIYPGHKTRLTTTIDERYFSGAHSDVGGGYVGEDALSEIPLRWMIEQVRAAGYDVPRHPAEDHPTNSRAMAHWSVSDGAVNRLTNKDCEDRPSAPAALIDASVADRAAKGIACVKINGVGRMLPYPLTCNSDEQRKENIDALESFAKCNADGQPAS